MCMITSNSEEQPRLVIIIPALNEEKTITSVITQIPSTIQGIGLIDTVVIDDGSRDRTGELAKAAGAFVVHHPAPMGVGAAFHTGLRHALERGADIIVNIDADGQFNPDDIPKLVAPILRQEAWFVTASRFADPRLKPHMPPLKRWGNSWMTRLINLVTGKKFTDVSCGFRAYTREAALRLVLFGHFTYTQETFIDLAFKGIPMMEIPLKVKGVREHGRSRVAGSLWHYGIKSMSIIVRSLRDYHPLIFFGTPALLFFLLGVAGFAFLLYHWLDTGQTHPYRSLVQLSGIFIILGFLLGLVAMIADMLHRMRVLLDKIAYLERQRTYRNNSKRRHD